MSESAFLRSLRQTLGKWFGRPQRNEQTSLHSAHTILAPPPPGGMRRVLPKRNKAAAQAAQAAVQARAAESPAEEAAPIDAARRGRDNIATLLTRERPAQALLVFTGCVKLDRQFQAEADTVLPLARQAMAENKVMLALRVMQHFDVLNPGHADTPEVILLSAEGMLALGKREAARMLVSAFRQHFPHHALEARVAALEQQLT